jgi:hypothetical protein
VFRSRARTGTQEFFLCSGLGPGPEHGPGPGPVHRKVCCVPVFCLGPVCMGPALLAFVASPFPRWPSWLSPLLLAFVASPPPAWPSRLPFIHLRVWLTARLTACLRGFGALFPRCLRGPLSSLAFVGMAAFDCSVDWLLREGAAASPGGHLHPFGAHFKAHLLVQDPALLIA